MSSTPPHCPNIRCQHHRRAAPPTDPPPREPGGGPFFRYKGSFARADDVRVRRYQCKACQRHFSEQTFRPDYRLKRPEITDAVLRLRARGYSIRAIARLVGIDRRTAARRCRHLPPWLPGSARRSG